MIESVEPPSVPALIEADSPEGSIHDDRSALSSPHEERFITHRGSRAQDGQQRPDSRHSENSQYEAWEDDVHLSEGERKVDAHMADTFSSCPIFKSSAATFVQALCRVARARVFEAAEILCRQSMSGDSLWIVQSGTVIVTVDTVDVSKLQAGDFWGESNLLGVDVKWYATLTAADKCSVCELRRCDLLTVIKRWPEEAKTFADLLSRNQAVSSDGTLSHTSEMFAGLSFSTLAGIDAHTVRRFYWPGQTIMKQGENGDSMCLLARGQVDIQVDGKVVKQDSRGTHDPRVSVLAPSAPSPRRSDRKAPMKKLSVSPPPLLHDAPVSLKNNNEEPPCFGELGLLGMQPTRTASLIAHTVCHVRILYSGVFRRAMEEHHESLDMDLLSCFLKSRYQDSGMFSIPGIHTLKEVELFQEVGCSEPFLEFLAAKLEDKIYLEGQHIMEEDVADDRSMYILAKGKAKVLKGGEEVAALATGAIFGELVMLGLAAKRQTTVVAEEVCFTQVLRQRVLIQGLENFPEERQKVLMIASKKETGGKCKMLADGTPDWKANNLQAVTTAIQKTPAFGNIEASFIEELSHASEDRIFMPGDLIIQEGAPGDSLFIMVSGHATVYVTSHEEEPEHGHGQRKGKNSRNSARGSRLKPFEKTSSLSQDQKRNLKRIGTLTAGSISGELAMLGVSQTRGAHIEADTICVMWEVSHEKAMPIIESHPSAKQQFTECVNGHLEHTVSNCIDGIDMFVGFDRKFRMLIGLYAERRAYFPGQAIFNEGRTGDGLYILNFGQARLERKGIFIKTCTPGSYFNSTVMLGIHKNFYCCLLAVHTSHVVVVNRISYVQATEQYPSEEAAKKIAKAEQVAEEDFRESVRRLCSRGQSWKTAAVSDAFHSIAAGTTDKEILRKSVKAWFFYTHVTCARRRQRLQQKQWNDQWVTKHREAIVHRKTGKQQQISQEDEVDQAWCLKEISPEKGATKCAKLSSLYLGSPRQWESMIPPPREDPSADFQLRSDSRHRGRQLRSELDPIDGFSEPSAFTSHVASSFSPRCATFPRTPYSPPRSACITNLYASPRSACSVTRSPRDAAATTLGHRMAEGASGALWPGASRGCSRGALPGLYLESLI